MRRVNGARPGATGGGVARGAHRQPCIQATLGAMAMHHVRVHLPQAAAHHRQCLHIRRRRQARHGQADDAQAQGRGQIRQPAGGLLAAGGGADNAHLVSGARLLHGQIQHVAE